MHSRHDKLEIMNNFEAGEVMKELFDSLKNRYKNDLESMKGREFVFDYVHLLYYNGWSYIDPPDSIEKNKANVFNTL